MLTPPRSRRLRWGVVHWEAVATGAAIAGLYFFSNVTGALLVGAFADDGVYAVLGKAIASGEGYRSLHLTGAPEHVRFPPGFPLVMAALWRLGGTIDAVQAMLVPLHCVVVGFSVALLWYVARVNLEVPRALTGAFVVAPFLLDAAMTYNSIAIAEPWYLLLAALVLVAWYRLHDAAHMTLRGAAGLGLLIALAILFRAQAVALLPAIAAGLWRRQVPAPARMAMFGVACLPPLLWGTWNRIAAREGITTSSPDDSTYLQWLAGTSPTSLAKIPFENAADYASMLGPYLSNIGGRSLAAILLLGLLGAGIAAIRRAPVPAVFAVSTVALLLVWPSSQDRLLLSWLPFAGLAACGAIASGFRQWPIRARQTASVGVAALAGLVLVHQLDVRREAMGALTGTRRSYFTPLRVLINNSAHIAQVSRWMRLHSVSSDRVLVDGGAGVFLYADRVANPLAPSLSRLAQPLGTQPAGRYLARRITGDSATLLISGPSAEIAREVTAVNEACPGTLVPAQPALPDPVAVLRVQRRDLCLSALATAP